MFSQSVSRRSPAALPTALLVMLVVVGGVDVESVAVNEASFGEGGPKLEKISQLASRKFHLHI